MRILVSGTTKTVGRLAHRWPNTLGSLITPKNRNGMASLLGTGLPWAADNGAYSGLDEARFRRMLARIAGQPRCLFVVCPDVVGDARATLVLFGRWACEVRLSGQPLAFVGQDGATAASVPWGEIGAFFVGGSTEWKLGPAARALVAEAKARGLHAHMGRVNSLKRLRYARDIGCDSVDGSSASMFGDRYIPRFCSWLRRLEEQGTFW